MYEDLQLMIKLLPFLIPLFIIQVALMVIALIDLAKRERVRGGNKVIWAVVIVLVNVIGPIIYLFAGRQENNIASD